MNEPGAAEPCRGCLAKVPAGDRYSFMWPEIRDLFVECTSIQIGQDENKAMPQGICKECYSKCEQWHSFRKMCEEVNVHLLAKASETNNNAIKEEPTDKDVEIPEDLMSHNFGTLIEDDEPMQELKIELDSSDECEDEDLMRNTYTEEEEQQQLSSATQRDCPICQEAVPVIWKHILESHQMADRLQCPLCDDFRGMTPKLTIHLKNHTGEIESYGLDLQEYCILEDCVAIRKSSAFNSRDPWRKLGYDEPKTVKRPQKTTLWYCPGCPKYFDDRTNLHHHFVLHANEKPYMCVFCHKHFTQKHTIRNHVQSCEAAAKKRPPKRRSAKLEVDLDDDDEKAPKAKRRSTRASGEHNKSQEAAPAVVDEPPETKPKVEVAFGRKKRPPVCLICKLKFETCSEVREHIEKTHPRRQSHPYECEDCGNTFKSSTLMLAHAVVHQEDRPFKCPMCDACFENETRLRNHNKRVHEATRQNLGNPTDHQCKVCLKYFTQAGYLQGHMLTYHSAAKKQMYSCAKCNKLFDAPHKRNFHMGKCRQ